MSETTTTEGLRMQEEVRTLRAEAVRLREALEQCMAVAASRVKWSSVAQSVVAIVRETLSSTSATQWEVERVRTMERVVEALQQYRKFGRIDDEYELDHALGAYEQIVKEKP